LGTGGVAPQFSVTSGGVLVASSATITGAITATSGTFTGAVNASSGNFTGYVTAGTSKFGANVASTNDGIWLDATNHWYDSGILTTNKIAATGGTIGGWTIGSSLYNGRTALTTGAGIYIGTDGIAIGATAGTPEFKVLASGALTATSATITGAITADSLSANTAGSIAGWEISSTKLESNTSEYRGLKLIPDDKIVGYGNSAHTNTSIVGQFSFGVAPPPAGGGGGIPTLPGD
jgi:hypothetical protein